MLSIRSYRTVVFSLLAFGLIGFGLKQHAQQSNGQGSGLTPPPKPVETKSSNSALISSDVLPFTVGEQLSFNVSWASFSTAARMEMEVADRGQFFGQESYQIKTKVETLGQVKSLFGEIDNQYTSYVNPTNGVPHRAVHSIRQGQRQAEETIVFDQSKQQAIFPDDTTVAIPSKTFDFSSLVYGLRLRSFYENEREKITALYGREVIELEAIVYKRERITTQTGSYDTVCIKFYPQKRLSKYRGYIWFTDDAQKLPVAIKARLNIGELRAELTSVRVATRLTPPLAKLNVPTDESGGIAPVIQGTNGKHGANLASDLPFTVGERLNYEIAWGNFASVGRASFEVRQQGMLGANRVFEFYGEATSTGAARTLISVNDQINSFSLIDKLQPVRTDIRLREGKRIKQVSANYDWNRKLVALSSGTVAQILPGSFDLLSLFYAVRACDLKIGSVYNFPFLDANNRQQMISIRVVKQETIGGPMGTKETFQLDILTPSKAILAQAWISDDSRRLPIYIATRTRFGELRFQLTNALNTK